MGVPFPRGIRGPAPEDRRLKYRSLSAGDPRVRAATRAAAKAEYVLLLVGIAVLAMGAVTLARGWLWVRIPGAGNSGASNAGVPGGSDLQGPSLPEPHARLPKNGPVEEDHDPGRNIYGDDDDDHPDARPAILDEDTSEKPANPDQIRRFRELQDGIGGVPRDAGASARNMKEDAENLRRKCEFCRSEAKKNRELATKKRAEAEECRRREAELGASVASTGFKDKAEEADRAARLAEGAADLLERHSAEQERRAGELEQAAERVREGKAPAAAGADELIRRARVLRESRIKNLRVFGEEAANPGEFDGKDSISVADHVLRNQDSPWVGSWSSSQRNYQERILAHELAHALHADPENKKRIRDFLAKRWGVQSTELLDAYKKYLREHDLLSSGMVCNVRLADPAGEALRLEFEREKAIIATLLDSTRSDSLHRLQQKEKRDEKLKLLRRDRKIAVLRLLQAEVEELMRWARRLPGAPKIPLPSRFPGDLHALRNEREYFAVAVEMYFYDPDRFRECYSKDEQRAFEALLDGGLNAIGVGGQK